MLINCGAAFLVNAALSLNDITHTVPIQNSDVCAPENIFSSGNLPLFVGSFSLSSNWVQNVLRCAQDETERRAIVLQLQKMDLHV